MKEYSQTQKKNSVKLVRIVITFLAFSVTVFGENQKISLKNGDNIVFWGDSITDFGWYAPYVQLGLAIKMRDEDIKVFNAGIGGDTTDRAMCRLDFDVFRHKPSYVFIFLGENDLSREIYSKPEMTKVKLDKIDKAVKNTSISLDQIKQHFANAVILGTTAYDQYSNLKATNFKYYNSTGKKRLSDELKTLAANRKVPFVDLYTPMTDAVSKHPEMHLCGQDRIHPSRTGHLLIALKILQLIGINNCNSAVLIDSGRVAAKNAQVKDLLFSDSRVSFNYMPDRLPLPVDSQFLELQKISSLPLDVNQEIIRVKGLTKGKYIIKIDGKTISTITSRELEDEFNIASWDTPNQKRAKQLIPLMEQWKNTTVPLRKIAASMMIARTRHADVNNTASIDNSLDEWLESCKKSPAYHGRKRTVDTYRKYRMQQQEYEDRLILLAELMRQQAKPVWMKMEILKQP